MVIMMFYTKIVGLPGTFVAFVFSWVSICFALWLLNKENRKALSGDEAHAFADEERSG